jgi:hypothetical protein
MRSGHSVGCSDEFFKSGDEKFELTVTAQLDVKGLRFNKAEGRNDDT